MLKVTLALFTAALTLSGAEVALRLVAPLHVSTIGERHSANAKYYGWGYDPGELIRLRDPDTLEVYVDVANNHGWRDSDRTYENRGDKLRVLALGDSNTFGVIVPRGMTWTALLESMLQAEGFDVEVLNMAYPRWGTDQELEALRREGLRYRPDVVVLQFTINDLVDNLEIRQPEGDAKPFHYEVGQDGSLERKENPNYSLKGRRDWLRSAVSASEILKRVYIAWTKAKFYSRPRYYVGANQLIQLQTVLSLANTDPLIVALSRWTDRAIGQSDLERALASAGHAHDRAVVERILENQPFKKYWTPLQYLPTPPDAGRDDWRLLLRLVLEIQRAANGVGASLAILSDHEDGLYAWEVYWHRIAPGAENRERFLAANALLRSFAAEHGIGFIEPRHAHVRARNDSHPNIEGTGAMARNVYEFLMAEHRLLLDEHRSW